MTETDAAFAAHIRKLQWLALRCSDQDRREDAVRSLACMVLLGLGESGDGEVVDLASYRAIAQWAERAA
jgi:hypothetical protein